MPLPISDQEVYDMKMRMSLLDKAFFMAYCDTDFYVDFGCGDGSLMRLLSVMFPEKQFLGFDNIAHANREWQNDHNNIYITTHFGEVRGYLNDVIPRRSSTFIASSVIHEIYSYCDETEIKQFWDRTFKAEHNFIAIRDFSVSKLEAHVQTPASVEKKIRERANPDHLKSFENKWGKIDHNKQAIHFLLKYDYGNNWEREVNENYLPLHTEGLMEKIPSDYEIIYKDHYVLPYLKDKVFKDFGLNLTTPTHIKLVLRKKVGTEAL